jgi:hypothetical protein
MVATPPPRWSSDSCEARSVCKRVLGACVLRLQAPAFAFRQPKEQFVLIQVAYNKSWSAPLEDGSLDALGGWLVLLSARQGSQIMSRHDTRSGGRGTSYEAATHGSA